MTKRRRPLPADIRVDAPECGPLPAMWQWKQALATGALYDRFLMRGVLGMRNMDEILDAEQAFRRRTSTYDLDLIPLPPEIPPCRLAMPEKGFSPDFFSSSGLDFASRRLREVLAQPPEVVEFVPIELLSEGEAARAQDYRLMRVLAEQPAMDLDRSHCKVREEVNWVTGERLRRADFPWSIVLPDDFQPRTSLFRVQEASTTILVTDALALRVLHAGCTGVEFDDFGISKWGMHTGRLRTTTGIALHRVGYLD